jgi:DNA-binding winged helix-turn-helix (wHTH) protein/predicted ATPase
VIRATLPWPPVDDQTASLVFRFPPFELDLRTQTLREGKRARKLRSKAVSVLRHLIAHAGRVTTPEEIFAALWPDVKVSPGVLKVYVWEIRRALRECGRAAQSRFIETVRGRGYRWIAPVTVLRPSEGADLGGDARSGPAGLRRTVALVARAAELGVLQERLARALGGERQIVLLTGEPGIGKTALAEAFLRLAAARPAVRLARGQCIEHHGAGEAYLPVLSALGQLGRGAARRQLAGVLRRHAPTWLIQLPSLLAEAELDQVRRDARGASHGRMLRELAEALERLTARRGLVLVLEDLQWSDASTLDLVAFLARRPGRARLLVLGTYRPAQNPRGDHPVSVVTQELSAQQLCVELPLPLLKEADVGAYLMSRFPVEPAEVGAPLGELAQAIYRRTEGNPLFMVNVVEDLLAAEASDRSRGRRTLRDAVARVRRNIPPTLRQMIERRVDRLEPGEQRLLEAASAAGADFSAATLGAALETPAEEVERHCARLARATQLLRLAGTDEWPDGTAAARYGFVHSIYQGVLYERVTPAYRRELHRRIGERLERAYGGRAAEVAAELALHFEEARDLRRAIRFLELAAEDALGKHANLEAARHLGRALDLLATLPDTPERARHELALRVRLGAPLLMTRGYAAPEVVATYSRALELCRQIGESPEMLVALVGLYRYFLVRLELRTASELAEQVERLGRQTSAPIVLLAAHLMRGVAAFGRGDLAAARTHLEEGLGLYEPSQRGFIVSSFGDDPGVIALADLAMVLWFLGYPDQALARSREALACAREAAIPYSLAFALNYAVWCRLLRGEGAAGRDDADALVRIAHENGFRYWVALGTAIRGWVLIEEGQVPAGVEQIEEGLVAYAAIGAELVRPWHLAKLADAYARMGRLEEASRALDEAMASMRPTEERYYEAEVYRLRGELALRERESRGSRSGAADRQARAEDWFRKAIEAARCREARSLELRAVLSLSRLWQRRGERAAAGRMLGETYRWFSEGFDTADLRAARALLDELGRATS